MLRLRTSSGAEFPIPPQVRFIELCDLDGQVAAVVYSDDRGGMHIHQAGEPEFNRYMRLFPSLKASKVFAPGSEVLPI